MEKLFKWGNIPLKKDSIFDFHFNNLHLKISDKNEIFAFEMIYHNGEVDEVVQNSVLGKVNEVDLLPAFPDRPLLVKPTFNHYILPSTSYKFYVYIPITVQMYNSSVKSQNKIAEYASIKLSPTWFGDSTEGELCYVLYSSFDTNINEDMKNSNFIICPIEIHNKSKEVLDVSHLALRVMFLNIYANDELMISNKVRISFNGMDAVSDVNYNKTAISSIPDLKQIASARMPENNKLLKRSFQFIRQMSQF